MLVILSYLKAVQVICAALLSVRLYNQVVQRDQLTGKKAILL